MHNIALMQGDGIGPEITSAAVQVIEATGVEVHWVELKGGEGAQQKLGTPLPDETLESYIQCGVGFKGPFTSSSLNRRRTSGSARTFLYSTHRIARMKWRGDSETSP